MFKSVSPALALLLATGFTAAAQPAPAKPSAPHPGLGFTAEAAVAQVSDLTGAELGAGLRYGWRRLRLTGMVGGFVHADEDDRYRSETFSNGNTVCRDTTSGRFADDANCAADVSAYAKLEASWLFDDRFEIGGGARVSEDLTSPYATLGYRWPNNAAVYVAGGDEYVALGLTFRR